MTTSLDKALTIIDLILEELASGKRNVEGPVITAARGQQVKSNASAEEPKGKAKNNKKKKGAGADKLESKAQAAPSPPLEPVQQADLRVAKIVGVEAVDGSDKLWKCQVDVGDTEPRQIVAGLQQHIPKDEMLGMTCVAICNLKPAKLAGQVSEGMLLAAADEGKTVVRTLVPPDGAVPGQSVFREGCGANTNLPKIMKSKPWAEVASRLSAKGGHPTFDGVPLCTAAGRCSLPAEIPDSSGIS